MEITPDTLTPREMHKLLIGSIVPRPIAWISTISTSGATNLAPYSFFNGVSSSPPLLSVCFSYNPDRSDHKKDTLRNIEATGEFVVNIVREPNEQVMHATSGAFDQSESEIERFKLTTGPSATIRPPRVLDSPIQFECTLERSIALGDGPGSSTLILGRIRHMHIDDTLIDEGNHIDAATLKPIGRLAGDTYCYVHEIFDLGPRPQ